MNQSDYIIIGISAAILIFAYYAVSFYIYWGYRKHEIIAKRKPILIGLQAGASLLYSIYCIKQTTSGYLGEEFHTSQLANILFNYPVVSLFMYYSVLRLIDFSATYYNGQFEIKRSNISLNTYERPFFQFLRRHLERKTPLERSDFWTLKSVTVETLQPNDNRSATINNQSNDEDQVEQIPRSSNIKMGKSSTTPLKAIVKSNVRTSVQHSTTKRPKLKSSLIIENKTIINTSIVVLIVSLASAFLMLFLGYFNQIIPVATMFLPLYACFPLVIIVQAYVVVAILRHLKDAQGIYQELYVCTISFVFGFVVNMTIDFVPSLFAIIHPTINEVFPLFIFCALLPHTVTMFWPLYLIHLDKQRPSSGSYNEQEFVNTLKNPAQYQLLKLQVAKDLSIENILFYEKLLQCHREMNEPFTYQKVVIFDKLADDFIIDQETIKHVNTLLENLVELFIVRGSAYELNISDELVRKVLQDKERDNLSIQSLDGVKNEVILMLFTNSFAKLVAADK